MLILAGMCSQNGYRGHFGDTGRQRTEMGEMGTVQVDVWKGNKVIMR